jgi:HlyD family secretion protein
MASPEEYETAETDASQAETELQTAKIAREQLKSQTVSVDVKKEDIELAKEQVALDQITLDNANTQKGYCTVSSPLDGVVSDLEVQKGTIIASAISNTSGGTTVMTISDMSHIYVLASVDESDIGNVTVGQTAEIKVDAFPNKHFQGKVVRIATKGVNVSNVVTFEVKVEVTSDNKNLLKPLMTADAQIIESNQTNVLTVPMLAVVRKQRKSYVSVVKDDGTSVETEVTTGINDGENQEIVSGLSGDEKILVHKNESGSNWATPGRPRMPGMGMPGGGRR